MAKLYTTYKDDLYVYWRFTTPERIREYAREHADTMDVDPERVKALWYKAGGMHICMTIHPPEEPRPRFTWQWWNWIRERAKWFSYWIHEYDHALRNSPTHTERKPEHESP